MKYILGILILSMMIACVPTKNLTKQGITFNEGDDLFYEINDKGDRYSFNINMNGREDYMISFDWEIPERNEFSGTIVMDEKAIQEATIFHYYVVDGYATLEDEMAIWVSQKVFKTLKNGGVVDWDLGYRQDNFKMIGTETYSFGNKSDGIPYNIPVIVAQSEDGKTEIWIAADAKNPIIVLIQGDFRMNLVDFKEFE